MRAQFYDTAPVHADNAASCPRCGSRARTTNTRPKVFRGFTVVWRERACTECGHPWSTYEIREDWLNELVGTFCRGAELKQLMHALARHMERFEA